MTIPYPVTFDNIDNLPAHQDEVMASHPGRPTPAEHIRNGATPPPGNDDYSLGGMP